jgi:nucleotidyltransferase substrate binding protein (TIGR01987 family)
MKDLDVRWRQRLSNYCKALRQLEIAVALQKERGLSEIERQGLIKAFEFTFELAWNVMKDYFEFQGNPDITGSRDAIREAFRRGLITDGEGWMEMIVSRNNASHTYNEGVAIEMAEKVQSLYLGLFRAFSERMEGLVDAE